MNRRTSKQTKNKTVLRDSFTVGSTKDEVLLVQGSPDAFCENQFRYGLSTVHFDNGRVVSWDDFGSVLKAKLKPGDLKKSLQRPTSHPNLEKRTV
jgi:hypothetical protein